ncbi:MAG: hypothetical protein WCY19_03030 [Candidatus Gastranaerophilaceae bacterium]
MAIGAVNSVSFGEGEQRRKRHIIPKMLGGFVVAGVPAYFLAKEPVNAKQVLKMSDDTFEKTFQNVPDGKKEMVEDLSCIRANVKKTNVEGAIEKRIEDLMGKGEKISVVDFLENIGFESKEALDKAINEAPAKTKKLTEKLKLAEETFKNAETEAGKKVAGRDLEKAQSRLSRHLDEIDALKISKTVIDSAKEGQISREAIKAKYLKYVDSYAKDLAKKGLEALEEDIPKVKSFKKAGIYGLIGAGVVGVLALIFRGKNKAEAPVK